MRSPWLPIARSRRSRSAGSRVGLTLVELLLAITLFAALLAAIGGLLRTSLAAQVLWGTGLAPYQRVERGMDQLAKEVASAQPFFAVPVTSDGTSLEFARSQPDWVRLTYRLGEADGATALIREESRWHAQASDSEPARQDAVMPIASLSFSFGALDSQQHLVWVKKWDGDTQGVPRLVKLDYTVPLGAGQEPLRLSRTIRNPAGALPTMEAP